MSSSYRLLFGSMLLIAMSLSGVQAVRAESGYYVSEDGPWCHFSTDGVASAISCFGFSRAAGGLVNYSCEYRAYSVTWTTWSCADSYGNRWGNHP